LSPKDQASGIQTVDAKLDVLCPNYRRMDALFGASENVMLRNVMESVSEEDITYVHCVDEQCDILVVDEYSTSSSIRAPKLNSKKRDFSIVLL
jgi:hypothetical protein